MEQGNEFFLQIPANIDQEIAATEEIEFGKWWIFNYVLLGKDKHVADAFVNPVGTAVGFGCKKPRQPLR